MAIGLNHLITCSVLILPLARNKPVPFQRLNKSVTCTRSGHVTQIQAGVISPPYRKKCYEQNRFEKSRVHFVCLYEKLKLIPIMSIDLLCTYYVLGKTSHVPTTCVNEWDVGS